MSDAVRLLREDALTRRNTFGVAATAPVLAEVADAARLAEALRLPELRDGIALVLGGGSNLLFAGDPEGAVLALTGSRVQMLATRPIATARSCAPTPVSHWHGFVMRTLDAGYAGLENLALIPGTVGAAPIQNIGAYGVEVRDFVHAVEAYEPATATAAPLRQRRLPLRLPRQPVQARARSLSGDRGRVRPAAHAHAAAGLRRPG